MIGVIDVSDLKQQRSKLVAQQKEYSDAIKKLDKVIAALTGRSANSTGRRHRASPSEMAARTVKAKKWIKAHSPNPSGTQLAKHLGIAIPQAYGLLKTLK
jgi:hypothetical protein